MIESISSRRGLLALAAIVVGCSNGASVVTEPATSPPSTTETTTRPPTTTTTSFPPATSTTAAATTTQVPVVPQSAACVSSGEGVAWQTLDSTSLREISVGDGVQAFAAEYPLPGPTDGLWSQWGQGLVTVDGRFLSAVGDHLGVDGNSHFFVYEPGSRTLTRFMDVLSVVDRQGGQWGFGKVHAQMVADDCDRVWAATYWGTTSGMPGYSGDHLLLIDPETETIADRGILSERRGVPSMTSVPNTGLLVAEAVDPETDSGLIATWDAQESRMGPALEDPSHTGFRALAVATDGRILYSVGGGELRAWDPTTDESSVFTKDLPGEWMRATTTLRSDGSLVGVTQDPPSLFSMTSDGDVLPLGDPGGYTTSLALDDDGGRVFWMAGAHGDAWRDGANVMSLDLDSGERHVVARLDGAFEADLGLLPGGTYSIVYQDGTLFLGVNSSVSGDESGFGTVVLVVIEGV